MNLRKRIKMTLLVIGGYLLFYLVLRILFVPLKDMTVMSWLTITSPYYVKDYLYGWIISSNLFWFVVLGTLIFSMCGKFRTAWIIYAGNIVGYILGCLLGTNPEGAAMGQGHYGWAFWIITILIAVVVGYIWERIRKKRPC